jgi:hypothetical protein
MKTIYAIIFLSLSSGHLLKAQFTMLKVWHEPVAGEETGVRAFDSTGAIPKSTGAGMVWDFTTLIQNSIGATSSSFVQPAAVPAASMYPGATLAESKGGDHTFFKSSATPDMLEGLGYHSAGAVVNYTENPMTVFSWPITMGTSFTDSYSGTISGIFNGNIGGTVTTVASGTGTVILPGGTPFANVLQLTSVQNATISANSGTVTNMSQTYFHSTHKFPLITVTYFRMNSTTGSVFTYSVFVNKLLAQSINDQNYSEEFTLYPNPNSGNFNVKLSNPAQQQCVVEILNLNGQLIDRVSLGNDALISKTIDISKLSRGVYHLKTSLGTNVATKKLVID